MAKKKTKAPASVPVTTQPTIYEASTRLTDGAVVKGKEITPDEAVKVRMAGGNVVVCGPDHAANMDLAEAIEHNASGKWKRCPFHRSAGPRALPHYQPDPRPPGDEGHTFYETATRKAV
jgi:hypothetical protein